MRTSAPPSAGLPHPLVFPVLQEAQQLRLDRQRQIADLIEQKRSPLASRDAAGIVADRSREGPLGVSEELAFQKLRTEAKGRR